MHTEKYDSKTQSLVLWIVTLAYFISPYMMSAVNIGLPAIQKTFSVSAVGMGWITNAYLLATSALLVPVGRIADRWGQRRVFFWGLALFTLSTLLLAGSVSFAMLITMRVVQGLSGAMIATTGMVILTSVFPPHRRGYAIGMTVAAVYVGLSMGPFLGGVITKAGGWRMIFLSATPLAVAATALVGWRMRGLEWTQKTDEKFDWSGSALYMAGLCVMMVGLTRLQTQTGVVMLLAGLVTLAGFLAYEWRVAWPVFEVRLLRANRVFAFSSAAAFIHYAATAAVAFMMSLYLQYIQGLSPTRAGLVLLAQPAMQAIFSPVAGRLSDKVEPVLLASVGMTLTTCGLAALACLGPDSSLAMIVGALLLLGFGYGLFSSPNVNAIMSSVAKREWATASGVVATMRMVGATVSMTLCTLILSMTIGAQQIQPSNYSQFMHSMHVAFGLFTAFCVVGIACSSMRGQLRNASGQ